MSDGSDTGIDEAALTGRVEPPERGQWVHAGPVRLLVLDGDVRRLAVGGVEIVRRIYLAVRDVNWNTIAGSISNLTLRADPDRFECRFTSLHEQGAIGFTCDISIVGTPDGRVEYRMDGRALTAFPYAKIGLCVHHPILGFAGQPYRGATPNGPIQGVLPRDIGPQIHLDDGTDLPLFDPVSQLSIVHESGLGVDFGFVGDLWEMEDQRNWSDASYKSASTPASLGYYHEAVPGQAFEQSIVVVPTGIAAATDPESFDQPVRLRFGAPTGRVVPPIGVGFADTAQPFSPAECESLRAVGPAHLRVDIASEDDPADHLGRAADRLGRAAALADRVGARLEVALTLVDADIDPADLEPIVTELRRLGPRVARILVFNRREESTSSASIDLVLAALGETDRPIVAGTNVYFNEFNRQRILPAQARGLAWSLNPQIHAFDDLSLIENLQAQPDQIATARSVAPGFDLHVTPITLRPRFNAVAVTDDPEAASDATDPRQRSQFAAAWTLGSVAGLSSAGVDGLTYFETLGPKGVAESAQSASESGRDDARAGDRFPVAAVLADACALQGRPVLAVSGIDPSRVASLAVQTAGGVTALLANLTRDTLAVRIDGVASEGAREIIMTPYETRRLEFLR